jgi:hypothetical protein
MTIREKKMAIEFETEILDSDSSKVAITNIFLRGNYRNREDDIRTCLKRAMSFYANSFQSATLVLLNVQTEDTKVNRQKWKTNLLLSD